jgi:hypothetical protein
MSLVSQEFEDILLAIRRLPEGIEKKRSPLEGAAAAAAAAAGTLSDSIGDTLRSTEEALKKGLPKPPAGGGLLSVLGQIVIQAPSDVEQVYAGGEGREREGEGGMQVDAGGEVRERVGGGGINRADLEVMLRKIYGDESYSKQPSVAKVCACLYVCMHVNTHTHTHTHTHERGKGRFSKVLSIVTLRMYTFLGFSKVLSIFTCVHRLGLSKVLSIGFSKVLYSTFTYVHMLEPLTFENFVVKVFDYLDTDRDGLLTPAQARELCITVWKDSNSSRNVWGLLASSQTSAQNRSLLPL